MGDTGRSRESASNTNNVNDTDNGFRTDRRLYSKSQVDELTADYTPEQFLGSDFANNYMNLAGLKLAADENMPNELDLGGYTFRSMGDAQTTTDSKNRDVIMMDYQSTEKIGNEYPVLQVGIRVHRTRGGKVKAEIIRDGATNRTRFW